jgi:hypothetical protein
MLNNPENVMFPEAERYACCMPGAPNGKGF